MELTNEILTKKGFKRVNNSMWRLGEMTLQNTWIHPGITLSEKSINIKRAYKACYKGKFIGMIENEQVLKHVIRMYLKS